MLNNDSGMLNANSGKSVKNVHLQPEWLFRLSQNMHQVYKWIDQDGNVQYTDQPPPSGDARDEKKGYVTINC